MPIRNSLRSNNFGYGVRYDIIRVLRVVLFTLEHYCCTLLVVYHLGTSRVPGILLYGGMYRALWYGILFTYLCFFWSFFFSHGSVFLVLVCVRPRGLSAEPTESGRRDDADAGLDDSKVAYIARSKRDVAEHFGVAWSTMQPRLVGKIGAKVCKSKIQQ